MLNKTIPVGVDGSSATITSYVFAPTEDAYALKPLPAVVVVPGGGYDHVSPREGEPVALRLLAMGYQAFVLNYSVAPAVYPLALQELARAVDTVRSHAAEYCVDPDRITVMGFSAGGHLVGLLGALWDQPWLAESIAASPESIRPDTLCLGYPVVSSGGYAHRGSFEHLTGADGALAQKLSIENMVGEGFPVRSCGIPPRMHRYQFKIASFLRRLLPTTGLALAYMSFRMESMGHRSPRP